MTAGHLNQNQIFYHYHNTTLYCYEYSWPNQRAIWLVLGQRGDPMDHGDS